MILFVSIPHSSTLDVCESSPLYIFSVSVADMNTLTERIKEAVQEAIKKGHTVLSPATACGCKDKSVYQWLKGERKSLDGVSLVGLAEASGFEPKYIMKGEGPKYKMYARTEAQVRVLQCMERMAPEQEYTLVKIGNTLAEPPGENHKCA